MGQKKENKCDGDGQKKKEENTAAPVTVVLKVDLHCDGCTARIVRLTRGLEGVETVKSDPATNKLTVIGFVDPSKIREKLQKKSKKMVELISPQPKKETRANNDKKPENQNPAKATVTTSVLKLSFHCDGCVKKIHKTLSKSKGVYDVTMDRQKELVTVTGTADVKLLTENLKEKLKRTVEILPPPKKEKQKKLDGVSGGGNQNKDPEERKTIGSPGQPGFAIGHGYGYGNGLGPCRCPVDATEIFSEEDPSGCHVM